MDKGGKKNERSRTTRNENIAGSTREEDVSQREPSDNDELRAYSL